MMTFPVCGGLCCPIDRSPLQRRGAALRCASGHSFDIARQGYVNLLSAADKRSRDPGDSRDMVDARREFLQGGYYLPIAQQLCELASPLLPGRATVVDAGCGEGYYLQHLQQAVGQGGKQAVDYLGLDISKWAVRAAARRFAATWLVASNRNIPLADHSADVLLCLFGFPVFDEFHRILKPDGQLLLVTAGPRHLLELRREIYPTVGLAGAQDLTGAQAAGFELVDCTTLACCTGPLGKQQIRQLLTMTPHGYRAGAAGRARAAALDKLSLTVDVNFQRLQPVKV